MAILRTDISSALDELINNEADTSFQALAVVLAKQKWSDLIASEWHNESGIVSTSRNEQRQKRLDQRVSERLLHVRLGLSDVSFEVPCASESSPRSAT